MSQRILYKLRVIVFQDSKKRKLIKEKNITKNQAIQSYLISIKI